MSGFLPILIVIAILATVGVLMVGLFAMARGGKFNSKYSNKLMRARIVFQFLAVILIVILGFISGKGE